MMAGIGERGLYVRRRDVGRVNFFGSGNWWNVEWRGKRGLQIPNLNFRIGGKGRWVVGRAGVGDGPFGRRSETRDLSYFLGGGSWLPKPATIQVTSGDVRLRERWRIEIKNGSGDRFEVAFWEGVGCLVVPGIVRCRRWLPTEWPRIAIEADRSLVRPSGQRLASCLLQVFRWSVVTSALVSRACRFCL
jgi:hypothetical protein